MKRLQAFKFQLRP
ncbi:hypothetical protein ECEC1845_5499, partial [Escherichia coli EC1845]